MSIDPKKLELWKLYAQDDPQKVMEVACEAVVPALLDAVAELKGKLRGARAVIAGLETGAASTDEYVKTLETAVAITGATEYLDMTFPKVDGYERIHLVTQDGDRVVGKWVGNVYRIPLPPPQPRPMGEAPRMSWANSRPDVGRLFLAYARWDAEPTLCEMTSEGPRQSTYNMTVGHTALYSSGDGYLDSEIDFQYGAMWCYVPRVPDDNDECWLPASGEDEDSDESK